MIQQVVAAVRALCMQTTTAWGRRRAGDPHEPTCLCRQVVQPGYGEPCSVLSASLRHEPAARQSVPMHVSSSCYGHKCFIRAACKQTRGDKDAWWRRGCSTADHTAFVVLVMLLALHCSALQCTAHYTFVTPKCSPSAHRLSPPCRRI
jgi:hypothetical protein